MAGFRNECDPRARFLDLYFRARSVDWSYNTLLVAEFAAFNLLVFVISINRRLLKVLESFSLSSSTVFVAYKEIIRGVGPGFG